jgi:chemotaxis protein histidine kinase CheA
MSMSPDDTAKYKDLYVSTARAYLKDMHNMVILLLSEIQNESELADEEIKAVFLAAHSLTGQSAVVGAYPNMTQCASLIEKIFRANIEDNIVLKKETLHHTETAIKKMLLSVDEIEKSGREIDLGEEVENLSKVA